MQWELKSPLVAATDKQQSQKQQQQQQHLGQHPARVAKCGRPSRLTSRSQSRSRSRPGRGQSRSRLGRQTSAHGSASPLARGSPQEPRRPTRRSRSRSRSPSRGRRRSRRASRVRGAPSPRKRSESQSRSRQGRRRARRDPDDSPRRTCPAATQARSMSPPRRRQLPSPLPRRGNNQRGQVRFRYVGGNKTMVACGRCPFESAFWAPFYGRRVHPQLGVPVEFSYLGLPNVLSSMSVEEARANAESLEAMTQHCEKEHPDRRYEVRGERRHST